MQRTWSALEDARRPWSKGYPPPMTAPLPTREIADTLAEQHGIQPGTEAYDACVRDAEAIAARLRPAWERMEAENADLRRRLEGWKMEAYDRGYKP